MTPNKITVGADIITLHLQNGKTCIVDSDCYPSIREYRWVYGRSGASEYCCRTEFDKETGRFKKIYMHREINRTPKGMYTDHINGCGLDNRKSNMRSVTKSQNDINKVKKKTSKSKYKGLTWCKQTGKWKVFCSKNGKELYCGQFSDEKEAAIVYNRFSSIFHGEFSRPNVIQD